MDRQLRCGGIELASGSMILGRRNQTTNAVYLTRAGGQTAVSLDEWGVLGQFGRRMVLDDVRVPRGWIWGVCRGFPFA